MAWKTIKIRGYLGDLPEQGATDWWTQEDWDRHNKYVEELKAAGKYGQLSEEFTLNFKEYEGLIPKELTENAFTNFGLLIPQGNDGKPREPFKFKYDDKP